MSSVLALHLLGSPQLQLNNAPLTLSRRKSLALLAYLALEGGGHRRESLSALLWPDYSQSSAYRNLRQILWDLQQTLGEGWLIVEREKIQWQAGSGWVDVHEFETGLTRGLAETDPAQRVDRLSAAVKLYRNHFLTGFSLKDAAPFNDWAFAAAEELRRKLAEALARLSNDHMSLGQADRAIPHMRRLVGLDPLNESAHRQLMEVYLQAGQSSAALKQYESLQQILRKELNLDPQPETRALYRQIRRRELQPAPVQKPAESPARPHNLPAQLSSFIGREKERAELKDLLQKHRLVTLAGIGGIGKTRLALQVGEEQLPDFPHGVWFIGLDALSDPPLVPQTVAAVFGIRDGAQRSVTETLIAVLQPRQALLIFDNCEHLLEACAELTAALLSHCPQVRILATSRETLNVPGEAVFRLPSLAVPERGALSLEQLGENESVHLFVERAALALSSFQLSEDNAEAIVEIGRKVGGIPLALELAAARVNLLQVEEILRQLNGSLALLASDQRTAAARHLTLQASMDWSWSLLEPEEQTFMRRLAVFAGGWNLEAAQVVCEAEGLGMSAALFRKSLVMVDQRPGCETRYRLHEIVREYALEQLQASGERAQVQDRHLQYFLQLSAQAEEGLRGPAAGDWMERLNLERNNFRAALRWADQTNLEAGLYLASRLMRYWESANLREGHQWLQHFLQKPQSRQQPHARARALHSYSWLLTWLQQFDQAYAAAQESLTLFRAAGDRAGEVDALVSKGNIIQFRDEMDRSVEIEKQAVALAHSLGDRWREAVALQYLGWAYNLHTRRIDYWETALLLYRAVGDQVSMANVLGLLAQFKALLGDFEQAERYAEEAMQLWQAHQRGDIWESAKIAKSLILRAEGEYEAAQALLEAIRASATETGNRMSYLWAQVRLGYVMLRSGDLAAADQLLSEAAHSFQGDGYAVGTIFALEGLADLYATVGKPERAARLLGWADATREKIHDSRPDLEQADVDKVIAACLARLGEIAFSEAYDEGRAFTADDAVAYALEGRDPRP